MWSFAYLLLRLSYRNSSVGYGCGFLEIWWAFCYVAVHLCDDHLLFPPCSLTIQPHLRHDLVVRETKFLNAAWQLQDTIRCRFRLPWVWSLQLKRGWRTICSLFSRHAVLFSRHAVYLFSRHALAMHDMLHLIIKWHYLAWMSLLKCTIKSRLTSLLFCPCYLSGHLTRKPYGCFRCPGNKINAVLMWFVFCDMICCLFIVVPK